MDERSVILDVNDQISFKTIYEAINWCAGTNYSGWMQACWPKVHPSDGYRIWFPKLSPLKNGKLIPLAFDCVNQISEDWNFVIFDDLKGQHSNMDPKVHYWGEDLIFAKEVNGDYVFRGVFVLDKERSKPNHMVTRRIATKAKLIGKPARKIELLDAVDSLDSDDINNPLRPQIVIKRPDGTLRYKCGRCEYSFAKSPRCPECGQLVKE